MKKFRRLPRRMVQTFRLMLWLGPFQTLYLAIHRLLGTHCISLRVPGSATPLLCRPRDSDIWVIWSAFFKRDCDCELPTSTQTIIDAGANVGYVSVFLANKYPAARIVAVEMDPDNVEILRKNVQGYNVDVVLGAVWSSHSHFLIDKSGGKSFAFRIQEVSAETPGALPTLTIADLMRRIEAADLGLLKLDIEGAEEALFTENYEEWIDHVRVLIVEVHGAKAKEAVISVMTKRNFYMEQQGEKLVFVKVTSRVVSGRTDPS
jgi:FkbM family methyltransferase